MVSDFIVGVVRNVLRHVAVEHLQRSNVRGSQSGANFLAVELQIGRRKALSARHGRRRSAQLRVLDPQVSLNLFQCAQERQNGDVTPGNGRAIFRSTIKRT